jgi:hypothetical protein
VIIDECSPDNEYLDKVEAYHQPGKNYLYDIINEVGCLWRASIGNLKNEK